MIKAFFFICVFILMVIPLFATGIEKTNLLLSAISIMMLYKIFVEEKQKGGNNE